MARGEVRYRLTADNKQFKDAFNEARDQIKGLADDLASRLGPAGAIITSLGPAGLAAGAALGAMAAAAGVAAVSLEKAISHADKFANLSAQTGLAATALQKLAPAAQVSGTSIEAIGASINKMQKGLVDTPKAFERLGLSARTLVEMKPDEAFMKVAGAIKSIENPTQQAAAAMAAFGKGGAQLLRFINSDFEEVTKRAEALGLVMSNETVAALDSLGDELDLTSAAAQGVMVNFGAVIGTAPSVEEAVSAMGKAFGAVSKAITDNGDIVQGAVGILAEAAKLLINIFGNAFVNAIKLSSDAVRRFNAELIALGSMMESFIEGAKKVMTFRTDPKTFFAGLMTQWDTLQKNMPGFSFSWEDFAAQMGGKGGKKPPPPPPPPGADIGERAGPLSKQIIAGAVGKGMGELRLTDRGSLLSSVLDLSKPLVQLEEAKKKTKAVQIELGNLPRTTTNWRDSLALVANQMTAMSGIKGKAGSILGGIGSVAGGISSIGASLKGAGGLKGLGSMFSGIGTGGLGGLKGIGNLASGIMGALGTALPIAGAAIGIGSTLFKGLKSIFGGDPVKKAQKEIGAELGKGVSRATAESLVEKAKEMGVSVKDLIKKVKVTAQEENAKALKEITEAGIKNAAAGIEGMVKGLTPLTQAGAEAQGKLFGKSFWALVGQEGLLAAADAMKPAFEKLKASGFELSGVLAPIERIMALSEDEAFRGAIEGAQGLKEALKGLREAGIITMDDIREAGIIMGEAFQQAIGAGATELEAYKAIAPALQEAVNTAKELGIPLDENTQKLVDGAKAAGLIFKEEPMTRAAMAMERVAAALERAFGFSSGIADELGRAAGNAGAIKPNLGGGGGEPIGDLGNEDIGGDLPSYEFGGVTRKGHVARIHGGEVVAPVAALFNRFADVVAEKVGGGGPSVFRGEIDGKVLVEWFTEKNRSGGIPISAGSVRR